MVEQSSFQSDKIIQQGQSPEAIEKSGLVVLLARPRATRNCGRKSNFDKAQGLHTTVGAIICKHPSALGCKGIVSKRLGSSYRPGRADWWCRITFSNEL
jgi:hypothetical protein